MKQNKTKKSKINPASLLKKNQSNPLKKKTAKAILFFFRKIIIT